MTGPVGLDLLDDPAALHRLDRFGLLPAAAQAGARARSVAELLGALPVIARPRALVVVGARAATDTALLTALLGPAFGVPVVGAAAVPSWVGPLDVVIVLAGAHDDTRAAVAVQDAAGRGALTIGRGAAGGPVAAAGAAWYHAPPMAAPEALALAGRLCLLTGVAAATAGLDLDLGLVADVLDAEALGAGPGNEPFVNPAIALAQHLGAGTPVLVGGDPVGDALARHGCGVLAEVAAHPAAGVDSVAAGFGSGLLARAAAVRDIFADFTDGDYGGDVDDGRAPGPQRLAPLLLHGAAVDPAGWGGLGVPGLAAALPRAPGLDVHDQVYALAGGRQDPLSMALAVALTAALRLDFAAVYLGLATGAPPPADAPAGLGPAGQLRLHDMERNQQEGRDT